MNIWVLFLLAVGGYAAFMLVSFVAQSAGRVIARLSNRSDDLTRIAAEATAIAIVWPIERLIDCAGEWSAFSAEWRAQRKIWFNEFRGAMPWAEFRLKMTGRGKEERDAYADALSLFGLTEPFNRADLDARFRRIMPGVHPDTGGTEHLAKLVTTARITITKRKGWKK